MRGRAYSPCAISSFFETQTHIDGTPIRDSLRVGSRGGGFVIDKGVYATVTAERGEENELCTYINGEPVNSKIARIVVDKLLKKSKESYHIVVEQEIEPPVGCGFGTSGSGAVAVCLATSSALGIDLTYLDAGRIAHVTDIEARAGLGTVIGVMAGYGGVGLVVEPGAPGIGVVDRLLLDRRYLIVAGSFEPVSKDEIIFSEDTRTRINKLGRRTMRTILRKPTLQNFLSEAREFSMKSGFTSERIQALVEASTEAGAVGASQNMIGKAVHAVVEPRKLEEVIDAFRGYLPKEKILVSEISISGPRRLLD